MQRQARTSAESKSNAVAAENAGGGGAFAIFSTTRSPRYAEARGLDCAMIEIRNDLVRPSAEADWGAHRQAGASLQRFEPRRGDGEKVKVLLS